MQQRRMRKNVGRYRCFNKKLGGLRKKHPGEGLPLPGDGGGTQERGALVSQGSLYVLLLL